MPEGQPQHPVVNVAWDDAAAFRAWDGGKRLPAEAEWELTRNVWEWTADWYERNYHEAAPEQDPRGPTAGYYASGARRVLV